MIACPYNARWFNFKDNKKPLVKKDGEIPQPKRSHGVAESCTFCAHRIGEWKKLKDDVEWNKQNPTWIEENPAPVPACVEKCRIDGGNALVFGNLDDPDSEISQLIANNAVKRLRDDLGTEPKVYYIGFPPQDPTPSEATPTEAAPKEGTPTEATPKDPSSDTPGGSNGNQV